mmetsp:Transcript_53649/g.120458  ORF Transcript_53649/g.120458 Transcript_53649/m.120458 type:complete len:103 (-) Transcript_53649:1397-1705(-)
MVVLLQARPAAVAAQSSVAAGAQLAGLVRMILLRATAHKVQLLWAELQPSLFGKRYSCLSHDVWPLAGAQSCQEAFRQVFQVAKQSAGQPAKIKLMHFCLGE